MATLAFTRSSVVSGSDVPQQNFEKSFTCTGSSWTKVSEVMTTGTNTPLIVAIDVSAVKFFRIHSTGAATIKTNDSGSPDDTITLVANQPYDYVPTDYSPFLLTVDVADIYVTNAAEITLTIEVLQDATP